MTDLRNFFCPILPKNFSPSDWADSQSLWAIAETKGLDTLKKSYLSGEDLQNKTDETEAWIKKADAVEAWITALLALAKAWKAKSLAWNFNPKTKSEAIEMGWELQATTQEEAQEEADKAWEKAELAWDAALTTDDQADKAWEKWENNDLGF
jgi:hypothetical protein